MELCGSRQMPRIVFDPKSPIIPARWLCTGFSATRCASKEHRTVTSIRCGIRDCLSKWLRRGGGGQQSRQTELGVNQLRSPIRLFFVDDNRNLDLRRGDQLNVDTAPSQAFEHSRRYPRM